jgi:hypothetical protein
MKRTSACRLGILLVVVVASLVPLVACSMGGGQSSFCDAGESDQDYTGAGGDFAKYSLFRFDTAAAPRNLTTPGAGEMIDSVSSAVVGQVIVFAVAADGFNTVTLIGGEGVTVKPGASIVAANTTRLMYCVIDSKDDDLLTIY